jgi:hypothetical protein
MQIGEKGTAISEILSHILHLSAVQSEFTTTISVFFRLMSLEEKLRDPGGIANIDCLLDTVTALVADCDHENVKIIKNVETYISRCKCKILESNAIIQ